MEGERERKGRKERGEEESIHFPPLPMSLCGKMEVGVGKTVYILCNICNLGKLLNMKNVPTFCVFFFPNDLKGLFRIPDSLTPVV